MMIRSIRFALLASALASIPAATAAGAGSVGPASVGASSSSVQLSPARGMPLQSRSGVASGVTPALDSLRVLKVSVADSCSAIGATMPVIRATPVTAASFITSDPNPPNGQGAWKPSTGPIVGGVGIVTLVFAMAALAGPRDTKRRGSEYLSIGAKANAIIYQGAIVVLDGLVAAPGRTAVGLIALGRARETVDNTGGADGDLDVPIEQGVFLYGNSGGGDLITKAHIGRKCYITDDQTVALTGDGLKSVAGTIVDVDVSGGVWVEIDIGDQLVPGTVSASALANVAAGDTIGGVPEVFLINVADASADTDIVVKHKVRVLRFEFHASGIAAHATADTVQLRNAANAITDAVAKTATVDAKVEAATYDPAFTDIAAGGTLRVHAVHNTNVAGLAIVTTVRIA